MWYYWDYVWKGGREEELYYKYHLKHNAIYLIKIPKDVYNRL